APAKPARPELAKDLKHIDVTQAPHSTVFLKDYGAVTRANAIAIFRDTCVKELRSVLPAVRFNTSNSIQSFKMENKKAGSFFNFVDPSTDLNRYQENGDQNLLYFQLRFDYSKSNIQTKYQVMLILSAECDQSIFGSYKSRERFDIYFRKLE